MTSSPFEEAIAIDTNVFLHLLSPQENTGGHINTLLEHLQGEEIALLVDDGGRIAGEYSHQITQWMSRSDDTRTEMYILRYWMVEAERRQVEVSGGDRLMQAIRSVIVETSENVDRIFVYVAFKEGKLLISNDWRHVVVGHESERTPRRDRLLRATRRHRPRGADILTSREAYDKI